MNWWNSLKAIFSDTESEAQRQFIESYAWSAAIRDRFARQHSELDDSQQQQVWETLRDYFAMCHAARGASVAMPSRIVDDAWHTFLLFTREYSEFCQRAFGRDLHHAPHEPLQTPGPLKSSSSSRHKEMGNAWRLACKREGLDPATAPRLPRIFAIDAQLNIKDGFHHDLHSLRRRHNVASGSGCSSGGCSGSSSTSTRGGKDSHDGNSGSDNSCSGGDSGGSSCGGGCGGGGD